MSISLNGAGNGNVDSAMTGTVVITNQSGSASKTRSKAKAGRKRLNYNHREISGQLLRAKKTQNAAVVLTRAKSKLGVLQRSAASGKYDKKEVANAIAHASRVIRCAQLKVNHLKQEESEQKKNSQSSSSELRQKKGELKHRAVQKERNLRQKAAVEEIQMARWQKTKQQEMLRKRRMNRMEELGKINDADMRYLMGQIENLKNQSADCGSAERGVILELSMEAACLNEEQIRLQAEREAEIAMEGELGVSNSIDLPTVVGGDFISDTGGVPALGETFSVSI